MRSRYLTKPSAPRGQSLDRFCDLGRSRVEQFPLPAIHYRALVESLQQAGTAFIDDAKDFSALNLTPKLDDREPYPILLSFYLLETP